MGEEIKKNQFSNEDFRKFQERLRAETDLVKSWFAQGKLVFGDPMGGFELEAWLVDQDFKPAPVNEEFLRIVKNPEIVHELSRFNVELNSSPYPLNGEVFSHLFNELNALWTESQSAAAKVGAQMVMIGILPTLRQEMLSMANISQSKRYLALNEQILRQRNGEPLRLDIKGRESLKISHQNIMLEATATSLQIHLNTPPEHGADFYNNALILSAPMVAVAANSPYLFGKDLWEETRIPVFEQAVRLNEVIDETNFPVGRVSFGSGYLKNSVGEVFEENVIKYPPLLPYLFNVPIEQIRHFRLHNGTIWRWNRPIIGVSGKDNPNLRLEHRVASAGPSIPDVIANIAFIVGLLYQFGRQEEKLSQQISFHHARENFYQAARYGLRAKVVWGHNKKVNIKDLIQEELIPIAERGLDYLGVSQSDVDYFLKEVMALRVREGRNGASWQREYFARHGQDFKALTHAYVERQNTGQPVYEWRV